MSSHIDFRTMPANVPVLCIPRVYPNISESRIRKIFDDLNMGVLDRIDVVPKTSEKGEKFNRVFVHFRRWNNSDNANTARERLLNGKEIKIIYDDPWFWKISAYREAERRPAPQPHNSGHRKATLAFDSDEDKSSRPAQNVSYRDDRRRRDDSRERPRRDDKPRRDDRPRSPTRRPKQFARRRDDSRERPVDKQENQPAKFEPRSPSSSPPRQRLTDEEAREEYERLTKVDYGNVPVPKRRNLFAKKETKPLVVEEGEVSEN